MKTVHHPRAAQAAPAVDPEPEIPGPETGTAADLAIEYLGVADALARRFRCPGHDAEDLRQVARLGLMKAAQRYRASIGHGFVPYAVPTIAGELKRYLRDQSWMVRPPRSIQELRLKINSLRPRLTQELGHEPTTAELSATIGIPAADVAEAQIADSSLVIQRIEHGDGADDPEERRTSFVPCEIDTGYERVDTLQSLSSALEDASEDDRRLLYLRFVREMTQDEIAETLGVSQMQVSRLLRRLLDRLRRRMAA